MATTLRALVMLTVLVGLPAAWVYYGPLPPQAQRAADRAIAAAKELVGWNPSTPMGARPQDAGSSGAEAPRFANEAGRVADPPREQATQPSPPSAPAAPPLTGQGPTFAERVEPLLAQLRAFGVAAYALERWGEGGALYRFRCEMPLSTGGELTQQFEAVAADPQSSVAQVVTEVSRWQVAARGAVR